MSEEPAPLWRQYFGLVVSGTLTAFIVFRIMAVADWDTTTARALLAHQGSGEVALGGFLASLPVLYGYGWALIIAFPWPLAELGKQTEGDRIAAVSLLVVPGLILLVIVPLPILGFVVMMLVFKIMYWLRLRSLARHLSVPDSPRLFARPTSRLEAAFLLALILFLLWSESGQPWMTTERIEVDPHSPFTGYILDESNGTTTILRDDPRQIESANTADLTHSICSQTSDWRDKSFIQLFRDVPYPECPDQ